MLRKFLLYNFLYFSRRLKETDDQAWFSTTGFLALAIAFNIATVLFVTLGDFYKNIDVPYPGYVLIGIPWLLSFAALFFSKSLKGYVLRNRREPIDKKWRLIFWIYFISTVLIYAFAMSFYSSTT